MIVLAISKLCDYIVETPFHYRGGFDFSEYTKKGELKFSHKKGVVGKLGNVVLKKGGLT